jgi:hypothetical protein
VLVRLVQRVVLLGAQVVHMQLLLAVKVVQVAHQVLAAVVAHITSLVCLCADVVVTRLMLVVAVQVVILNLLLLRVLV